MTILLTGGTGKTATRIARLLKDANQRVLLTSRKGVVPEPFRGVKFDWHDPSTFENVFTADPNIERIYLVAPGATSEVFPLMKPFIDLAVQKGVAIYTEVANRTVTVPISAELAAQASGPVTVQYLESVEGGAPTTLAETTAVLR